MSLINKILQETIGDAQRIVQWPDSFVHARSGVVYKPHNDTEYRFVYEDAPMYMLLKGGEGCSHPNTKVNGIPIAEWDGGLVDTLHGQYPATKSYLKGKTDLYFVETLDKKNTIVTLDHRFLTTTGWKKLLNLKLHDKINTENGWNEINTIKFHSFGDYYDLTVPVVEHYLADGIYSHNSGKTTSLVIKILNRLRKGCNGAVISPNMPSFRRSLFPELLNWLPRSVVIDSNQRFFLPGWRPRESFIIVVHNELGGFSELLCASAESPRLLEGPNLNFVAMDEIRGMVNEEIIKVMPGRVRITGPNNEPPQLFCSSTPSMDNWMYTWFGPVKDDDSEEIKDFKAQSYVATITVQENILAGNLPEDFVKTRGAVLSESEKKVRILGEWANESNPERFIPDMIHWDTLIDPKLGPARTKGDSSRNWSDAMVLAIDASVNRDTTAIVGVTRHPANRDQIACRLIKVWEPKGTIIDFKAVEEYIKQICGRFHVVMLCYDSFQMENMAQSLYRGGVVYTKRFNQQAPRTLADQFLFDSIMTGGISHMGDPTLRKHLENADIQTDVELHKKRIVKRSKGLKIDAAVALSMANYECKRLNI